MKILLIQPPAEDFYQTTMRTLPVGLLYLASSLQAAGTKSSCPIAKPLRKSACSICPQQFNIAKVRHARCG